MAGPVYPVGATRIEGETLSLSTTLASLGLLPQVHQLILYNPAADFRLHLNPALVGVQYYDASASSGSRFVDDGSANSLVQDLSDRASGTGTGTVMDSGTTSDFLYFCFSDVVSGLRVTMKAANGTVSTLTGEYRKNDDTWASLSVTDGTRTGGNTTLGQTGSITWTEVTDWKATSLSELLTNTGGTPDGNSPPGNDPSGTYGYWMRLSWSVALDSDTEIQEVWSLNKNTSRAYFRAGQEYGVSLDRRAIGAFEAILASGSDTLEVNYMRTVQ